MSFRQAKRRKLNAFFPFGLCILQLLHYFTHPSTLCINNRIYMPTGPWLLCVASKCNLMLTLYRKGNPLWCLKANLWNCISKILFKALTGHISTIHDSHSFPAGTSLNKLKKPQWLQVFSFFYSEVSVGVQRLPCCQHQGLARSWKSKRGDGKALDQIW